MTTPLWRKPHYPNQAGALAGRIGIGAPLIAVAELTTLGVIMTQGMSPIFVPWVGPTTLAMCVSVVSMVISILYGFEAVRYWNTPDDQLAWAPAARADVGQMQRERENLAHHQYLFARTGSIADVAFRLGLASFLAGLAFLLIPPPTSVTYGSSPAPSSDDSTLALARNPEIHTYRWIAAIVILSILAIEFSRAALFTLEKSLGRINEWNIARHRESATAGGIVTGLQGLAWRLGKPIRPDRWRPPFIAIGRPDKVGIAAVRGSVSPLPDELVETIYKVPQEWGRSSLSWTDAGSVSVGGAPMEAPVWVSRPWALFGSGCTITVVHPLGAISGHYAPVSDRLRGMDSYFDGVDGNLLSGVLRHIAHYQADAHLMGCEICEPGAIDGGS